MPVFGVPVTEGTRKERAIKAYCDQNVGGKCDEAIAYLNTEKEKWGNATRCMFYNATGESLVFYESNSLLGHVYDTGYPHVVQNGQWGAFVYLPKTGIIPPGAIGLVVYRGTYIETELFCKQLFAWKTPGDPYLRNLAYCDIFDDDVPIDPNVIYKKMEDANASYYVVTKKGMLTSTITEDHTISPFYKAILTIEEAEGVEASST